MLLHRLLGGMRALGRRWNAMTHSSCQQSSKGRAGRPCPSGTTRTQHSLSPLRARCQPRRAAASSQGHLAAFVQAVLMARSILSRLECQTTRIIQPGKIHAFSLFLPFPLNPTATKEATMPFINTDGTTLLLRQICG